MAHLVKLLARLSKDILQKAIAVLFVNPLVDFFDILVVIIIQVGGPGIACRSLAILRGFQLIQGLRAPRQTASQQPAALFNWRVGALLGSVTALPGTLAPPPTLL